MQVQWDKLIVKLAVWLAMEVILSVIGLDDLADYGEYIFRRSDVMLDGYNRVS